MTWRERAWHNAVRLANAPTSEVRQLVANEIEQIAAAEALALKVANAYLPPDQQHDCPRRLLRRDARPMMRYIHRTRYRD